MVELNFSRALCGYRNRKALIETLIIRTAAATRNTIMLAGVVLRSFFSILPRRCFIRLLNCTSLSPVKTSTCADERESYQLSSCFFSSGVILPSKNRLIRCCICSGMCLTIQVVYRNNRSTHEVEKYFLKWITIASAASFSWRT